MKKSLRQLHPVEYSTWKTIKSRCYSKSQKDRGKYRENNIEVCERWINSFDNFFMDMGEKPGPEYSIERVNNNKNYTKENCKWCNWKEQSRNRGSFNITFYYNGKNCCLSEIAENIGVNYRTLYSRIKRGLSFEDAIKQDPYSKLFEINGVSKHLKEWCKDFNVDFKTVNNRVFKHGWEIGKALSTPVKRRK